MARNDGRIEAGQRLSSAISARAWNRAQDAADMLLGGMPEVMPGTSSADPTVAVAYCERILFGEARNLGYRQTAPGQSEVIRQQVTPYTYNADGTVQQPSNSDKAIIGSNGLVGYGLVVSSRNQEPQVFGSILGVSLEESLEPGYRRFRVSGRALVRVIAYSGNVDCTNVTKAGGVSRVQTAGATQNPLLDVGHLVASPIGTRDLVVLTSLPPLAPDALFNDANAPPSRGWGIVYL